MFLAIETTRKARFIDVAVRLIATRWHSSIFPKLRELLSISFCAIKVNSLIAFKMFLVRVCIYRFQVFATLLDAVTSLLCVILLIEFGLITRWYCGGILVIHTLLALAMGCFRFLKDAGKFAIWRRVIFLDRFLMSQPILLLWWLAGIWIVFMQF